LRDVNKFEPGIEPLINYLEPGLIVNSQNNGEGGEYAELKKRLLRRFWLLAMTIVSLFSRTRALPGCALPGRLCLSTVLVFPGRA
jgi:hypothetical protein